MTTMNDMGMWMRMPGQSWPDAAAMFLGMWMVMMVPMMLPSLVPMLRPYRRDGLGACVAALGYFAVWAALGLAVFPVGAALAAIEMQWPAVSRVVPFAAGVIVLIAGAFQFSSWKAHSLTCCRETPPHAGSAWRHGLHLGVMCARCCGNLMVILLALGMMDLRVMAVVTAAITVERWLPAPQRVARATGVIVIAAGLVLVIRAAGAS